MEALWVILTLLVAAGVGWPVTTGVLKIARSVDEHQSTTEPPKAVESPSTVEPPNAAEQEPPDAVEQEPPSAVEKEPANDARRLVIPAAPTQLPSQSAARQGVLRGGLVIGMLERLGVAGAILANEPVAIAYVVAIKGLGRYAELKDTPAVAERFIIGTLTSLLWAAAVAVAAAVYLL